MTLHSIHFFSTYAILYRREGGESAPRTRITRALLPLDQQTQWDVTIAALGGLLSAGERVLFAEINPAPPVATAWEAVDNGDGTTSQNPTAWRSTLHVAITIGRADRGSRSVGLSTEQFSVTAARDALLALWTFLSA